MSIGRRVRVLLAVVGLSLATALPVLAAQGPTKLEAASVSPDGGSTTTTITFQVTYRSVKDLPPDFVRVTVAGATHAMTGAGSDWKGGVRFTWRGTLPMGTHDVVFKARDAEKFVDELNAGPVVIGGVAPTPRPTPDPSSGPDPSTGPDPSDPAPSDDPGASTDPGASGDPTASADPSASNDPSASTDPSPSGDPAAGGAGSVPEPDERDGWWLPADGGSGGGSGSGTGSGSGSGTGSGTTTGPGGSESAVEPEDDGGIAAAVGRWIGSLADAAGGTVDAFLGVLVAGVPGPGASALGGGGRGSLPTVPSMVLTTTGVGVWMAFMLFGKRRRDEEPPAPDAALQLAAAAGSGRAGTAVLATAPVPMLDPEALMPRWRRPSLLEARKTDPVRAPAAARPRQSFDTAFGDIDATMERRLVRYAVVQLLDRPDEVYAERIGEVEAGDEIAVVAQSGVYRQVRCPDGREGWIHRMTLGDVVVPVRDRGYDEDAQGPSIDAAGAMAALLAARGLR